MGGATSYGARYPATTYAQPATYSGAGFADPAVKRARVDRSSQAWREHQDKSMHQVFKHIYFSALHSAAVFGVRERVGGRRFGTSGFCVVRIHEVRDYVNASMREVRVSCS